MRLAGFWKWFASEGMLWKRFLFEAPLYALVLLSLLLSLAAYQVRRPLTVDIGGPHDAPYLQAFHDPEPDWRVLPQPPEDFRWTRARARIDLQGIGQQAVEVRLRMRAPRPADLPVPTLWAGGYLLCSAPTGTEWQVYRLLLPAPLLPAGDLHLEVQAETFRPATDRRDLGVSVDWIEVRPASTAWVEPSWSQVAGMAGAALLAYLLLRRWRLSPAGAALLVALGSLFLAYQLAFRRLSLTPFTPTLVLLLAAGALLTAIAFPILERWGRREGLRVARRLGALLLLGFLVRMGGMLHPQFRSSDLIFHVHRAEWVLSGHLLFTADLPDVNLPAPYPPGLYLAIFPATLLSLNLPLMMQIAGAALDTAAGLLLYALARRLTGRKDQALLAVLLQQVAPVTFLVFSWGNYTNMFSRVTLLATLVLMILGRWRYRQGWIPLAAAFGLVLLSHFADSLLFGGFILAVAGLALGVPAERRSVPRMLGALLLAGALVLALYYSAPVTWRALQGGFEALFGGRGRAAGLVNPLPQFLEHVQTPVALLALPGLALLRRRMERWPAVVLGGALVTALVFALGQAFFGFSVRYSFFILPVLALGASAVLAALWRRRWVGRLAVGTVVAYLVGNGLWTWGWLVGFGQR